MRTKEREKERKEDGIFILFPGYLSHIKLFISLIPPRSSTFFSATIKGTESPWHDKPAMVTGAALMSN